MPIGDFSVEGVVDAVDSASSTFGKIRESIESVSNSMSEASVESQEMGASANAMAAGVEVAEESVEELDDEIEDLNRSLSIAQANATGAMASIQSLGTADLGNLSDDPEGLRHLMETDIPESLMRRGDFRRGIAEELGETGPARGRIAGNLSQMDVSDMTAGDLAGRLGGRRDVDANQAAILQAISSSAKETAVSMNILEEQTEDTSDDIRNMSLASMGLSTSIVATDGALSSFLVALSNTERQLEDVEEEIDEVTRSLAALGPALSTVSANLGPFNFALQNVLVTLPVLFASIGPLITALGALATAFIGAAVAMAAFATAGAFLLVQDLEENFAGIEDTMQAVEAIAQGLGEALRVAFEPLLNAEFAGMGAMQFFVRLIQNTMYWLHLFAEAMAEILEMEEMEEFFFRIEEALLGIGDETGGITMLEGLKQLLSDVLPIVTDVVVWLIDKLPEAMTLMGDVLTEVAPALSEFTLTLINFIVTLTRVGAAVLTYLLPAISAVIGALNILIITISTIMDALGPFGSILSSVLVIGLAATLAIAKLASIMSRMNTVILFLTRNVGLFGGSVEAANAATQRWTASLLKLTAVIAGLAIGLAVMTAGITLVEQETGIFSTAVNWLVAGLEAIVGVLTYVADSVYMFFTAITDAVGVTGAFNTVLGGIISAIKVLIGLVLIAAGAYIVFTTAAVGLSGTMLASLIPSINLATTSVWGLTTALLSSPLVWIAGAIIAAAVAFREFGIVGVAAVGMVIAALYSLQAALIGTGIGAIIVAIGYAILVVADNWDALVGAFETGAKKIVSFIDWILGPLDEWAATLLEIIGLQDTAASLLPAPGVGEDSEGSGLGSIFAKTASGAAIGAGAGSVIPGAGTAGGAVVGGIAGLADATVMQEGGFTESSGLAFLHPNEFVIPADKLRNAFADAKMGTSQVMRSVSQSGGSQNEQQSPTNVTVNIQDNNGIDARRSREIGRTVSDEMRIRNRRETGFQ